MFVEKVNRVIFGLTIKSHNTCRAWWLMPIIQATWEAEVGRIAEQKVSKTLFQPTS
jgi:hypothetical protein